MYHSTTSTISTTDFQHFIPCSFIEPVIKFDPIEFLLLNWNLANFNNYIENICYNPISHSITFYTIINSDKWLFNLILPQGSATALPQQAIDLQGLSHNPEFFTLELRSDFTNPDKLEFVSIISNLSKHLNYTSYFTSIQCSDISFFNNYDLDDSILISFLNDINNLCLKYDSSSDYVKYTCSSIISNNNSFNYSIAIECTFSDDPIIFQLEYNDSIIFNINFISDLSHEYKFKILYILFNFTPSNKTVFLDKCWLLLNSFLIIPNNYIVFDGQPSNTIYSIHLINIEHIIFDFKLTIHNVDNNKFIDVLLTYNCSTLSITDYTINSIISFDISSQIHKEISNVKHIIDLKTLASNLYVIFNNNLLFDINNNINTTTNIFIRKLLDDFAFITNISPSPTSKLIHCNQSLTDFNHIFTPNNLTKLYSLLTKLYSILNSSIDVYIYSIIQSSCLIEFFVDFLQQSNLQLFNTYPILFTNIISVIQSLYSHTQFESLFSITYNATNLLNVLSSITQMYVPFTILSEQFNIILSDIDVAMVSFLSSFQSNDMTYFDSTFLQFETTDDLYDISNTVSPLYLLRELCSLLPVLYTSKIYIVCHSDFSIIKIAIKCNSFRGNFNFGFYEFHFKLTVYNNYICFYSNFNNFGIASNGEVAILNNGIPILRSITDHINYINTLFAFCYSNDTVIIDTISSLFHNYSTLDYSNPFYPIISSHLKCNRSDIQHLISSFNLPFSFDTFNLT